MRITSFNANGIRSAASKGFFDWFTAQEIDFLCVQETKAQAAQLSAPVFHPPGYQVFFKDAQKKGYSGVAIYTRRAPDEVLTEIGLPAFDDEGRYIEARFGSLSVVSFYWPSGSSGQERQQFKFKVLDQLRPLLEQWLTSGREYVLCGDWNIVRSALDIKNWKSNQTTSGCLPAERAWLNTLIADGCGDGLTDAPALGWRDALRVVNPEVQDHYTWWSNRGAARAKNVGWRIDYQLVTPALAERIAGYSILTQTRYSDHAPFTVDYRDE